MLFTYLKMFYYPLIIVGLVAIIAFSKYIKDPLNRYKIQESHPKFKQVLRDAALTALAPLCFLPSAMICIYCAYKSIGFVYTQIPQYGWTYFIFSILLIIIVHDTYYYWMHRFLHLPFFFKHIHYVHHVTKNPTTVTFYAMHPIETVMMSFSMPLCIFLFPVSLQALAIGILLHTLHTIYGHSGYEILPARGPFRWLNTSVAHNLHHQNVNVHYSYYFNIWDRLFNTLDKNYWKIFQK